MARNPSCTVFIGNLDEKVSERLLYEILIQVGRIVDLYIPRDKETNRHKGYAFAEYESEEIANYAVRLFSGLVRLHNKTLRFAISGQDKPSQNPAISATSLPKPHRVHARDTDLSQESSQSVVSCRASAGTYSVPHVNSQASANGFINRGLSNSSYEYSRRVLGAMLNDVSHPRTRHSIAHPSH